MPLRTHGRALCRDAGFAMVALLVGMSVAAIWMTAALPAWRQQAQRAKEEDLIFRGEQYARAIVLYQEKNRGALPPSIDVLVSGHYLRKKWKDPITGEDFVPVGTGIAAAPGSAGQPAAPQTTAAGGRQGAPAGPAQPAVSQQPGVSGVRSKSTAASIKVYQQQQQYNLWQFDANLMRNRMGRQIVAPGGQQPGGRQGGPGERGTGPGPVSGRGGQSGAPGTQPAGPIRGGGAPPPGSGAAGS